MSALPPKRTCSLQADACGPGYSYDSHTLLEKKGDMRRRGAPSPDEWDAVALTFAQPVGAGPGFSRKLIYPEIGVV